MINALFEPYLSFLLFAQTLLPTENSQALSIPPTHLLSEQKRDTIRALTKAYHLEGYMDDRESNNLNAPTPKAG